MENNKFCLDASVIVKFLLKEKDSNLASQLLEKIVKEEIKIIEPNFCQVEVYCVVRKKCHLKEIVTIQAKTALKYFQKLEFQYVFEDKKLLGSAYTLAEKLEETVIYDCLYLALAKNQKARFITADQKFFKKARSIYKPSCLLHQILN